MGIEGAIAMASIISMTAVSTRVQLDLAPVGIPCARLLATQGRRRLSTSGVSTPAAAAPASAAASTPAAR